MTFEDVYTKHYQRVRLFCLGRLGNPFDAEEAAQDTFIRLFRAWDKHEEGRELGFLLNTAKWVVSMQRRRRVNDPLTESIPSKFVMRDPLPGRLLDMIWNLKRLQRRAVVMYYYADMSFEEIGAAMGTGISTAEYRTKAGVQELRRAVRKI